MANPDGVIDLAQTHPDHAGVLTAFKERGLTITEAIKASMQAFGLGLGDAKSLVAAHPPWAPTAEAARPFEDDLIQAFQDIAMQSEPAAARLEQG